MGVWILKSKSEIDLLPVQVWCMSGKYHSLMGCPSRAGIAGRLVNL